MAVSFSRRGSGMALQLEAIKLNHDPTAGAVDALNVRRDATTFVTVPEWRRGFSVNPDDSPAAYSIADTLGHTLTIQAQFSVSGKTPMDVEIRAVDPAVDPPGGPGCIGWLLRLIAIILRALFGNVLGDVKPQAVALPASGLTPFITFELQNARLWSAGVGARTTTWRWQYRRRNAGPWTDIATTTHRIYSLLTTPTAPWQQTPYASSNTQLPWVVALDYGCRWAVLKTDALAAGGAITRAIYNLGPSVVEYDCPGYGGTRYAIGGFDLGAFIDRLKGGPGRGKYVNCTDCATFVSTFANLIGCDLWQSRMEFGFDLNANLSIGASVWQPSCGWKSFNYHEVAWTGACDVSDRVYDACLQVDGDADPTSAPHTPLLPINMVFGTTGSGDYRDRLATPAGRPNCNPKPGTRQRRAVH
jgi:hypothetical protein